MKSDSATNIKNNFSAYLDCVKRGESVLVLEYGRPVAQFCKPGLGVSGELSLAALEREGLVTLPQQEGLNAKDFLRKRVKLGGKVSVLQALLSDREESQ